MNEEKDNSPQLDTEELTSSLRSRLSNFWYFYKWQTILFTIIIIGVIAALTQMSGNTEPDVAVMYVGPSYLTVKNKEDMAVAAQSYMTDYNGDGEKSFHLLDISVVALSDGVNVYTYQANAEAQRRFTTEVTAGDSLIYILEESFYRKLIELNAIAKLSDVLDADMIPEGSEEYGVQLKELDFFKQSVFSAFPGDAYICIRSAPKEGGLNYGRSAEYWDSNKVFFRSVFAYRKS